MQAHGFRRRRTLTRRWAVINLINGIVKVALGSEKGKFAFSGAVKRSLGRHLGFGEDLKLLP